MHAMIGQLECYPDADWSDIVFGFRSPDMKISRKSLFQATMDITTSFSGVFLFANKIWAKCKKILKTIS